MCDRDQTVAGDIPLLQALLTCSNGWMGRGVGGGVGVGAGGASPWSLTSMGLAASV